jgi:RNA polymerase sigma-32 factor
VSGRGSDLAGADFRRYIREVEQHPLLTPAEEQQLAKSWFDDGDVDAARKLVLGNLRFALKLALEYRRFGPLMDLVQEANLGLMEAVRRFDPYRGYRLITYAVWWIRAYLQRYVVESGSIVRRGTTRDQRKALRGMSAARAELARGGEAESAEALAEIIGVDESAVTAVMSNDLSLDMPLMRGDGESGSLYDVLPSDEMTAEDRLIEAEDEELMRQALNDVLESLDDRDREILRLRLLAVEPVTLQQLADQFSISRERVRQLESGLRKRLEGAVSRAMQAGVQPALPPAPDAE